jgi:plasmid stabilization system protein ParE
MTAIDKIAFMPNAGAPREVQNKLLPGLRMWRFRNYLVFYITPEGVVDIVRVLHGAQDIGEILEDEI